MVDLATILVALACMTYIGDLDAYGLHLGDEIVLDNFIDGCQGFAFYI
jgi:hypothetical protein